MKSYPYLLMILFFAVACQQPKTIYEELRAEDKLEAAYHFNASTLRMLNFGDDPALNKLVRDVRKVSLLSIKPDILTYDDIRDYAAALQTEDSYDLYAELEGPENQCYIMGNAATDRTLALIGQDNRAYLLDITGKIDIMQLPKIYQHLSNRDTAQVDGFTMLFDLMQEDAENEERRREYRRKRAEEKALKEAEKVTPDSILLD